MGSLQQICLRWNNHQSNFPKVFDELLQTKDLVDVTLTCDGRTFDAHKVVLSACSPYFRKLFQNNPCKHPIVFMRDVKYSELEAIIEFMYKGEVNVARDELTDFLRTAQALQIKGLAEEKNSDKNESVPPKVQQSIPRSTLPGLIQPIQNNGSNSNSLHQPPAAKKLRLTQSHPPSLSSKLNATPHSTPPHINESVGQQSPQPQSTRKIETSSYNMERLMKLEMSNDDIDDDDDDESRDENSCEDQQGLDLLMESTLETGDEHFVDGEGNMYSHGLEKHSDSSELSQLDASPSTSGISNQLLQSEGIGVVPNSADRYRGIWTDEEIDILMRLWVTPEVQDQLQSKLHNTKVYENISKELSSNGYHKTTHQCRIKIKKLKAEYYSQCRRNALDFSGRYGVYLEMIYRTLSMNQA